MSIPSLASLIKRRDLSGVVSDTVSYYTTDPNDETIETYKMSDKQFHLDLGIPMEIDYD